MKVCRKTWWTIAGWLLIAGCQPQGPVAPAVSAPVPGSAASAPSAPAADVVVAEEPAEEPEPPFALEPDFQLLSRADFDAFGAEDQTWTDTPDGFACTGKPRGYLYTKAPYQNFTLRLDYRFPRPPKLADDAKFKGNTGFLIYITGEHKLWPMCLEVQGKHVQMGAVKENGGAQAPEVQDDDAVRQAARKPVGQWNALEIVSKDGALTVRLNGQQVAQSQPAFLSAGPIGIQAEDHPFTVRRMRIRVEP